MEENPERHKTTFVVWPHVQVYLNVRTMRTERESAENKMAKIRNIEKLCKQITEPIFNLQKSSYMFRLPSVAILWEKQYSNILNIINQLMH
jgi:hypothetical protein